MEAPDPLPDKLLPDLDTVCRICQDILFCPIQHVSCGNLFCRYCVARVTQCPLCKEALCASKMIEPALCVKNFLSEIQVSCKRQCGWIGTRGDYFHHSCTKRKADSLDEADKCYTVARTFCKATTDHLPQNPEKGEQWYHTAAEMGHREAQCALADIYYSRKDYSEAPNWYLKAADQGLAEAQFNLGVC